MSNGSGTRPQGACEEIREFLTDLIRALSEERIRVVFRESNDHTIPEVISYHVRYRGVSVRLTMDPWVVSVGGMDLGPDVCDSRLFTRIVNACNERRVFQDTEDANRRREEAVQRKHHTREPHYELLASRLRRKRLSARKVR